MKICLDCGRADKTIKKWGGGTLLCLVCRTKREAKRNLERRPIYGGDWAKTSRAAREETPWCSVCFSTTDLTLDHETGTVQCRSCNSKHFGTTIK